MNVDTGSIFRQIAETRKTVNSEEFKKITGYKAFYDGRLQERGFMPYEQNVYDKLVGFLAHAYAGVAKKGLFLVGGTGNGKTTALIAIGKMLDIEMITAKDLADTWKRDQKNFTNSFEDCLRGRKGKRDKKNPCPGDLIVDDLGAERPQISFGDRVEIGELLIDARYQQWCLSGKRLLLSSNLSIEAVRERYGERAYSRILEMCTVVPFRGQDVRVKGVPVSA